MFSGTVASVTPTGDAVTLREHMSLVELPDGNYKPRVDDPRAGYGGLSFVDYSVPIGEPMVQRWVRRHRIEKRDPKAAVSEPVKPIVYYVDSGAPDDVKKALVEGAGWWNQAFEAAGFRNGFKVDVLPEGADPMDIRYNMINWVHRSTRGWSSGATVADPRTGEIIKATVTLGSLRDRQDHMIFEGLLSPYTTGSERPPVLYETALKRFYGEDRLDRARPLFDLTLLGLGEDGHIASLFPDDAALFEHERWVVAVERPGSEPRITLTYPALESSRTVAFLVAGTRKRDVLARALAGDPQLPATKLHPVGDIVWFADRAAAP